MMGLGLIGVFVILGFFLLLLLGGGVIAFILSKNTGAGAHSGSSNPRQILDNRLARGEISLEEYKQLCDEIGAE